MEQSKNNSIDNKNENGLSKPVYFDFFIKDKNFAFIYKKSEKLLAAVYAVTNLFPEDEPMRWTVRDLSVSFLRQVASLKDKVSLEKENTIRNIQGVVLEITTLFGVASLSGLVSEMNFSILNREFGLLIQNISNSTKTSSQNGFRLTDDFFGENLPEKEILQDDSVQKGNTVDLSRTDYIGQETIKDKKLNDIEKGTNLNKLSLRDSTQLYLDQKNFVPKKTEKEIGVVKVKKNSRQIAILNIVKRKKEVTIKDISTVIKDYSEKTIQRELSDLVSQGVLKKEGERRWSKYSLVV